MSAFLAWWETFPLTHVFFSPEVMWKSLPIVARGFPVTLIIGLVGFSLAIPFGLALSFLKMSKIRVFRYLATIYIDLVRGTPLALQILIFFLGLPLIPAWKTAMDPFRSVELLGIGFSAWLRCFLILSFNSAAYMAEIFRAGIQSISKGQMEAARSLGMKTGQAMAFVILPQTIRRILPTMMSEFILLFKDTALLAMVSIGEVMLQAKVVAGRILNMSPLVVAAFFYLLVTIPLGRAVALYENRLAEQDGGGVPARGKRPPQINADVIDSAHIVPHNENILTEIR